ncbi:hypothetical protein BDN70DRAFT_128067 [Pholiota conissans]|uniref:Uncharacterized protein n=1 Tax=Pholiota conissans TaxID=109636 RepID=A0A9P5YXV9_9AGAR|nr:hypothetical protein BDN70DRAFT_128067 [Pholiota conissans]
MSTLLAVSKFLGGRSRERRRVDSTSNLVPINTLSSVNDVVPQGAPKNPPSKLSNVVSSSFVSSPLSTLKARRTRTDSILESSLDANSVSASSYLQTTLNENLPSNTNAPSGSAESNDLKEKSLQSEMQNVEFDGAKKRAQDLEQERDQALSHARDARDGQEKAQMRILELEDTLKSVEATLNSKSQTLEALTISSGQLQLQIDTLEVDLQKSISISKAVEDERDKALTQAREANDAHTTAQSHIQALEDDLTRKSDAVDKLTTDTDRMQSQIDVLTTDLLHSTSVYKNSQLHVRELEDVQTTTTARIQELEDDLGSTKAELSSNAEALVALTASSGVSQSKIDALTIDLGNSIATSKNLEEERDRTQLRVSELEVAQTTAMARVQELEGDLKSTGEELSSKIQENVGLKASAVALQSQIDVLTTDLRLRVEELDQERAHVQVLAQEGEEHRASAQKYALDLEGQRDDAIISAQGANDALVKAQARIHALEDELSSQSQTISALTTNSSELESKIEALTTDLHDVLAVRKDVEDERDKAISRTRDLSDAQKQTQARNKALEKALRSTKTELSKKSQVVDDLNNASKGLQARIDTLDTDLSNALALSRLREDERDIALADLHDATEAHATAQVHAQELEDALRSTKTELGSKAQAFDALTSSSNAQRLQIDALKSDLHDALAVRKDIETERDSALVRARTSEDAHEKAESQIRALDDVLRSTKAEVSSKSQDIDALTTGSKALKSEIVTLKSVLHDALVVSKLREEERDTALIHIRDAKVSQETAQVHIHELEDTLKSTMDELGSKSQALKALTATSKALQSEIDALKSKLQDALDISTQREEERDNALILARESEDAHGKALERIRALEDTLQSTRSELSSKSQEFSTLVTNSRALQSQIDVLKADLDDALVLSKLREAERDTALIQVREANDARVTTNTRIRNLQDSLESTIAERDSKSEAILALTTSAGRLQSQIDTLVSDLHNAQTLSKLLEDERDRALIKVDSLKWDRSKLVSILLAHRVVLERREEERNEAKKERDRARNAHDEVRTECDKARDERDEERTERDRARKERDEARRERDRTRKERDDARRERDVAQTRIREAEEKDCCIM